MPGKPGLPAKLGTRVLDDPAIRELYLSKIREKNGRNEAARLVDLAPSTVWRYVQDNPAFLDEIQEAEAAKVERAHKFWFETMEDEEAPLKDRLKASELLERAFGRESKRDAKVIEHRHELVISGDQMERVLAMQERLALEAGTIEGTVINERTSNHD
jgi:hypothetical protein